MNESRALSSTAKVRAALQAQLQWLQLSVMHIGKVALRPVMLLQVELPLLSHLCVLKSYHHGTT